jgi:hypothetical protein
MFSVYVLALILTAPAVESLEAFPPTVTIRSNGESPQLVVTGRLPSGKLIDLTESVEYRVEDPSVVTVSNTGRVQPHADGKTTIIARSGSQQIWIPVTTEHIGENLPINFTNQIEPIFFKLGCNAGNCHGKIAGQGGFRLSLLGAEPQMDYNYIVKESRGRRVSVAAPERSLLLQKAAGLISHGGGPRFDVDSDDYKVLRRWIASGLPFGKETDPVVTRISIYPEHRILPLQSRQQLAVVAHYSDGTVEDVTRQAQYESNFTDVAKIDSTGLVQTLSHPGLAGVMARYQGLATVFQVTVARTDAPPTFDFPTENVVDRHTSKVWRDLGLKPSTLCTDEQFLRRASLDISSTLPTPDQITAFIADRDPKKREKLIDRLLETPEYAYTFANKWADILQVTGSKGLGTSAGTFAFHDWIRQAIADDKPYDGFVREILGAVGSDTRNPPVVWYRNILSGEKFVDSAAQAFLGQRLVCAQCHHHPYEKWTQDDFWGLAAFYSRVSFNQFYLPAAFSRGAMRSVLVLNPKASYPTNPRTGKPALPKMLDGEEWQGDAHTDARVALADWMVDPKNPFFAKTVANRYFGHFFSRGIVDPLDDLRVTNPPTNPGLLDALAQEVIADKFSLKHLIRVICTSQTYQLSSTPNETNAGDKQAYSRYYAKRLKAEVLYDAICQATATQPDFGLPADSYAQNRAIMLPDGEFPSYFLQVFGRPQRISACECERGTETTIAQSLHLLNSNEVQQRLTQSGSRADKLANDPRPDAEKVNELFLCVVGHGPTEPQRKLALETLAAATTPEAKRDTYGHLLWALVNSQGFQFNY